MNILAIWVGNSHKIEITNDVRIMHNKIDALANILAYFTLSAPTKTLTSDEPAYDIPNAI